MEFVANFFMVVFWSLVIVLGIMVISDLERRHPRKERGHSKGYERFRY